MQAISISPKFLKIITEQKDFVKEREKIMKKLMKTHDYVPEEERGAEFISLESNCYNFKVDGITEAYDIIAIFMQNFVDDVVLVTEMKYGGETLEVFVESS